MKHLIMGTAGHVDHGKTSLIKALTNIDCDTHKEEKERGITINLGFSHLELPSNNSIGIIDVPGHKDFINTMVGGASGIDFVLIVIAADSGIMPQTLEHFNIIKTLKIKKAIIALNKIDLVDDDLAELAKLEIMEWLENTAYQDAPIVSVSSTTGQGLDSLVKEIDQMIPQIEQKEKGSFFRMYIDRFFLVKGMGSVVTGSVLNGEIKVGEEVLLLPENKQKLRIRQIERHGQKLDKVVSGDRAAFNLSGLKKEDFNRGMLLSNKEIETTQMIDAQISLFENTNTLKLWSSIIFHAGTFETQARMHLLNKDQIEAGESALVQIHLEKETVLLNKDKFIIRNTSGNLSFGGGIILNSKPLHHRKRSPKLLGELQILASSILNESNTSTLIKLQLQKENKLILDHQLAENLNMPLEELTENISSISTVLKYSKEKQNILILEQLEEDYRTQITAILKQYHQKNYILSTGLDEVGFYGKLGFSKNKIGKIYLGLLLAKMKMQNKLDLQENTWVLKEHKATIDAKTEEEINNLAQFIKAYDVRVPVSADISSWAKEHKIDQEKLRLYYRYLNQQNLLIHYKNETIHKEVFKQLKKQVLDFLYTNMENGFYIGEIREATGLSKKMAPLLLSWLEENKYLITSDYNKHNFNSKLLEKGQKEVEKERE